MKGKKKPRVVGTSRQGSKRLLVEHLSDGSRVIHLDDETLELLEQQRELFVETFGREPDAGDPLFFDPDYPEPTPITIEKWRRVFLDAAGKAGIEPARALALWEEME